jgi:hypothetical protein
MKNIFRRFSKVPESKVDAQWKKYLFEESFTESLLIILLLGTMAELSPFFIEPEMKLGLLLPIIYFVIVTIIFFKFRYRLKGNQILAAFILSACFFSAPFGALAILNPDILSRIGIMNVGASKEISTLFFWAIQALFVYSGALYASIGWRITLLNNEGLSRGSLLDLHKKAISKNVSSVKLEETLYGIPDLRQSFINGEYGMVVAWGWSIIDRTLEALTGTRADREGAKRIGFYSREFERCYTIRNAMVHDGYLPNHNDALLILKRVKALLSLLSHKTPASTKR